MGETTNVASVYLKNNKRVSLSQTMTAGTAVQRIDSLL